MQSISFDGVGKITGGEYDDVKIDGVCDCNGDIKAEQMNINGVFHCYGSLEAKTILCDGVAEFKAYVKAGKLDVDGVFNVKNGSKIEADEIACDGVIKVNGEISADIINADGYISAKEIVGDKITIKSRTNFLSDFFTRKFSDIELIEATTVHLSGVKAQSVNGKEVFIGPKCKIENIHCNGTLFVDKSAIVKNITGDYTSA